MFCIPAGRHPATVVPLTRFQRIIMKKLAALTLLISAATLASAQQSSVTLFGVVDLAARSTTNGDNSVKSLASGGYNSSRIGVRGTEDMGGGLRGGFWLEGGLAADSGKQSDSTRFFDRRSTVSVLNSLGELRLGRDITPTYAGTLDFDVSGDSGVAAGSKFYNKLGTTVDTNKRADNQVSYFLPSGLGGLYGQASVAAGEGTSGKKYAGARVGYGTGPLNLSVAYGATSVTPLAGGDDKYKVLALGASYDLRFVKLLGYYREDKYAAQSVKTYNLGASVPIGLGTLRAAYTSVNGRGNDSTGVSSNGDHATQLALTYAYNLSKRTVLYSTAARVDNRGKARYVVDGNPALQALNNGKNSSGYEVGIRHAF
jgi:predicted porin